MDVARVYVFEGPDGSGKSTVAVGVKDTLIDLGYKVKHFRLPGGLGLGEDLRTLLLNPDMHIDPLTQAYLMAANRCHYEHQIQSLLRSDPGTIVLMERWTLSSEVYQSQLIEEMELSNEDKEEYLIRLNQLNQASSSSILPYYIYITADEELRVKRKLHAGSDRYEQREIDFHKAIDSKYAQWAMDNVDLGSTSVYLNNNDVKALIEKVSNKITTLHGEWL